MSLQLVAPHLALLALAIAINVLLVRTTCASHPHCWPSLIGHWYPSLLILFVAYHTPLTSATSSKHLNFGMIAFGFLYILIDVAQKGLDVTTYNVKTIQHDVTFHTISVLGITRARRTTQHTSMFEGEFDALLFFVIAVTLVIFMANHPQPTATGNWMHGLTAFYIVLWFVFGMAQWRQRAQWAMWFAAFCFIGSQQGLCTLAAASNVDTVAFSCLVHLLAYCTLLCLSPTPTLSK